MTKLAVPIMVDDYSATLRQMALAAERGGDLIELRFDRFTEHVEEAADLVSRAPLPVIVTVRPTWEGGHYEGDDAGRLAFFRRMAQEQPAYMDVELAAYQRDPLFARQIDALVDHPGQTGASRVGLILSSHDFQTRPADLIKRVAAMLDIPACRVMKFAWRARSLRDNLEAFEIISAGHKPTIALCMGEFGLPSRVLARKFGALLTFATIDDASATAPGQVTVETVKRLYRWEQQRRDTAVYGVIGWPVGHSMSPAIHNAGFDAAGYSGVYLPLPIPPEYEHFKATVASWLDEPGLNFRGASVTIPHKENLLRFVAERGGEIEPLAADIGAANTLTVGADGSLRASNTDYAAALDSVCAAMKIRREELKGRRVAVIGAGGAARAVVAAFAHDGAIVVVYNRTAAKADELAARFGAGAAENGGKVVAAPLENLCKSCCEIIINCTPIGMHPHVDASPLESFGAEKPSLVFDTIYNPVETKLLREARAAGIATVSGVEMFVRQAAVQFELWTQQPAPVEVFRRVVLQKLGGAPS